MLLTFAVVLFLALAVIKPLQKNVFFMLYFALMLASAYGLQYCGYHFAPFSKQSFLMFLPLHFLWINVVTFMAYGADKKAAKAGERRTPEMQLHLLEFLGGTPAAFVAQKVFRHKTKKQSYQMFFLFVLALQIAIIYYVLKFLNFFD